MAWIENDSREALFVRQVGSLGLWTFPGGKVKRNESLERALKREVREETGLKVSDLSCLKIYDRPKRGAITFLFWVSVERRTTRVQFPIEEIADLGFFSDLPGKATPSAKFFWDWRQSSTNSGPS